MEFPQLDNCDGELLTRPFNEVEVKLAIWDCDGSKSPGPNGFNLGFFKWYWGIVKDDVMRMMKDFHDCFTQKCLQ